MPDVERSDLDELINRFQDFLRERPEKRREMHIEVADALKRELDAQIGASGVKGGKIQSWQQQHVGSGGGYAAIRPIGTAEGATTGKTAPARSQTISRAGTEYGRRQVRQNAAAKAARKPCMSRDTTFMRTRETARSRSASRRQTDTLMR